MSKKDTARLTWLLRYITNYGANGITELPWSVVEYNGEDSHITFDRRAIDRAMKKQPNPRRREQPTVKDKG